MRLIENSSVSLGNSCVCCRFAGGLLWTRYWARSSGATQLLVAICASSTSGRMATPGRPGRAAGWARPSGMWWNASTTGEPESGDRANVGRLSSRPPRSATISACMHEGSIISRVVTLQKTEQQERWWSVLVRVEWVRTAVAVAASRLSRRQRHQHPAAVLTTCPSCWRTANRCRLSPMCSYTSTEYLKMVSYLNYQTINSWM